ncbi:MAG: MBL fold metallo-hydrolase [Bacteroidales bacterium]
MKIHQVINSFYSSNSYILYNDTNDAYIVDCGDTSQIISWLLEKKKTLKAIFITHTHFDHIYGLNDLLEVYKDLFVYTSYFGKEALFDSRKNISFYHEQEFYFQYKQVEIVEDRTVLSLWDGIELRVYETKGHDKSCLTYAISDYLFTGDSYIPRLKIVTTLPNSDKGDAIKSERLIKSLINGNTIVCPGHGEIMKNK